MVFRALRCVVRASVTRMRAEIRQKITDARERPARVRRRSSWKVECSCGICRRCRGRERQRAYRARLAAGGVVGPRWPQGRCQCGKCKRCKQRERTARFLARLRRAVQEQKDYYRIRGIHTDLLGPRAYNLSSLYPAAHWTIAR